MISKICLILEPLFQQEQEQANAHGYKTHKPAHVQLLDLLNFYDKTNFLK